MYTDNFKIALSGFDMILDELAKASRKCNGNCNRGITIDVDDSFHSPSVSKDTTFWKNILDDIDQVIYNDPATIVTFKDGSKVCVKASSGDKFNKETGLVYAIVKRLYANDVEEKTGYLRSKGLGEKINKIVSESFDQKEQERKMRAKRKAKSEKKAKEKLANDVSEQAAKEAVDQIYDNA